MPNRIFVILLGAWFVGSSIGSALDQTANPTNWYLENIGVTRNAIPETPHLPIVIAIVDDGVRVSHQDLKELIWTNTKETPGNRIDDDGNGYVDDVHGWDVSDNDPVAEPPNSRLTEFYHGTHLAGIVAQLVRRTYSAPASDLIRIMPVKALSDGADRPYIKDGYKGIEYAVRAGADIVLCAWGVGHISLEQERILEEAHERGVLIVASAGNFPEGRDQYPAAHDSVIGVAALDAKDRKTAKSNFGAFVNLSAPGAKILSTSATSDTAYEERDGTSQSAALVAGAAAIVKLQRPSFSETQITACLKQTATNIESVNERYNARLGAGRLNVGSAAECPLFDDTTRQRRMLSNPQGFLRITRTEKVPFSLVIRTSGPIGGIRFTPRISGGRSADSTVEFFREESGQPLKVGSLFLSDFHSDFFVPGNTAYVAVATVGAGEDLDWLLEYRAEPIDLSKFYCRDTVHLYEEGAIDDGSGSHDYTYDNDCKWLITAPEGKVIEFKFIEFDTQPKVDFVYFFNGSGTHEDIMAGFSGPEIPPEFKTWSNQVLVWFVTDGDVQGKGWKAEFRFRDPDPPGVE